MAWPVGDTYNAATPRARGVFTLRREPARSTHREVSGCHRALARRWSPSAAGVGIASGITPHPTLPRSNWRYQARPGCRVVGRTDSLRGRPCAPTVTSAVDCILRATL